MTGEDGGVVKGPKWVEPEFVKRRNTFPIRGDSKTRISRKSVHGHEVTD